MTVLGGATDAKVGEKSRRSINEASGIAVDEAGE